MTNNTKARHLEILKSATEIVWLAGGVAVIDALPSAERLLLLRDIARGVVSKTKCHPDTAKRNVAKALRKARWALMNNAPTPDNWGGDRIKTVIR